MFKPLLKLAGAAGIATMAVCGLATPPAYAYFLCGTVSTYFSDGGHCTENCATQQETCTGAQTGTVRVVGVCRVC
jgi:hypothetical protein